MKKLKVSLMIAFVAIGITGAFAFKGNANFSCSGQLFYLDPVTGFQPIVPEGICDGSNTTCLYYEDELGQKQPCDEPRGVYIIEK